MILLNVDRASHIESQINEDICKVLKIGMRTIDRVKKRFVEEGFEAALKMAHTSRRFEPAEAKRILDRFEFVFSPKHGRWLDMAEIELNALNNQCLRRRIDSIGKVRDEVEAWEKSRNGLEKKINWQFTTTSAKTGIARPL